MTGVLVPESEVVLVAPGFGRVVDLEAHVGDTVATGDVLAELDVRGDKSEFAVATAAWKAAKAEVERLELELEQAKEARSDVEQIETFISKAELRERRYAEELAAARKRSAGASLKKERSKLKEASERVSESELRAPFDGVVARRWADSGATLATGEPVVQLMSHARVVRFAVPEDETDALRVGAKVDVQFGDDATVVAEVSTLSPEIDAGTRLVIAEARFIDAAAVRERRIGEVAGVRFAGEAPSESP